MKRTGTCVLLSLLSGFAQAGGVTDPPFHLPSARFVQVMGHRISYYEKGSGPAILLVHGCSGSAGLEWGRVIDTLAVNHRVVAPYQIGFPPSDQPDIPYNAETFVDHLGALIQQLHLNDVTLVGESFGGWVVGAYAVESSRPGSKLPRIAKLVVSDGVLAVSPEDFPPPESDPHKGDDPGVAEMTAAFLKDHPAQDCQANKAVSMDRVTGEIQKGPTLEQVGHIDVPTLIIWGAQDKAISVSAGERLSRTIPGARLVLIDGASHVPMVDRPIEWAETLLRFVDTP